MTNFLIGYADIPLTATLTASETEDSSYPRNNVTAGHRGNWHQIATATANDYYILFDGGSNNKSAQYLAIQRAKLLQKASVLKIKLTGSAYSPFTPSSITGCKLWLDATRGVTKDGSDKVNLWADLSGEGNDAAQSGGANKPTWVAPSSGINGNAALLFDGSTSYMTANGVSSVFSGDDKPFTVAVVVKSQSVAAGSKMICEASSSSSSTPLHGIYQNGSSNYNSFRRGDSGGVVTLAGGTPSTNTRVLVVTFTGTACSAWLDGSQIINAGSQDVVAMTVNRFYIGCESRPSPTTFWNGYIGEMIVYDSALGTSDRQSLEGYLTSKWITTPQVNEQALDTETLVGPRAEDFISAFSASSSFRYWWLQLGTDAVDTSKYPLGKSFFGSWFDFGREPAYPFLQRREAYSSGSREARYIFECEWQGIDDATLESFIDKVVKYRDIFPVVLYDAGDYCLNDMRTMHAWLTRFDVDKYSHNANNVFCVFEEAN